MTQRSPEDVPRTVQSTRSQPQRLSAHFTALLIGPRRPIMEPSSRTRCRPLTAMNEGLGRSDTTVNANATCADASAFYNALVIEAKGHVTSIIAALCTWHKEDGYGAPLR